MRRLAAGVREGDVLLLHDGNTAHTVAGRPVVLEDARALCCGCWMRRGLRLRTIGADTRRAGLRCAFAAAAGRGHRPIGLRVAAPGAASVRKLRPVVCFEPRCKR